MLYSFEVVYVIAFSKFLRWWHSVWIIFEFFFISSIAGVAILCPAFSLSYFMIFFDFQLFPLRLQNLKIKHYLRTRTNITKITLLKKITKYCKIYLFNHQICFRVNKIVKTVYNVSIWLNFLANICCIFVLTSRFITLVFRLWITMITSFQISLVFFSLFMLIQASDQLYCAERATHESVVRIFCERSSAKLSVKNYLKLSQMFEILHPKNVFRFKLGSFGKISPRSLMAFLPVYSSMLFKIFPYFKDKHPEGHKHYN